MFAINNWWWVSKPILVIDQGPCPTLDRSISFPFSQLQCAAQSVRSFVCPCVVLFLLWSSLSKMFHQCLTSVSPVFHQFLTIISQVFHQCFISVSPMFHQCLTSVLPLSHQCLTTVSPVFYLCCIKVITATQAYGGLVCVDICIYICLCVCMSDMSQMSSKYFIRQNNHGIRFYSTPKCLCNN